MITITLVGCENDADKSVQSTTLDTSNFLSTPPSAVNSTTAPITNSSTAVLPTSITTSQAGMNPEHGKPGHRCDIAVGAPLNSAPVTTEKKIESFTVPPATTNNAVTTPLSVTAPLSGTAPGMNPEHGKPGHRCDIAVGAPLNSSPTNNTNSQTITPQNTTNTVTPINVNPPTLPLPSTAANTVTAPGMNPQHGQPGHRCDIAVGAPLNSKPKQ